MESDKNPFPKFELQLLPRTCRVFHFIFDHLQSEGLSEHNRGAAPALDAALYDTGHEQLQIDFEAQSDVGW